MLVDIADKSRIETPVVHIAAELLKDLMQASPLGACDGVEPRKVSWEARLREVEHALGSIPVPRLQFVPDHQGCERSDDQAAPVRGIRVRQVGSGLVNGCFDADSKSVSR
jgi:hypothetical protein